jgi:hypothetical protein
LNGEPVTEDISHVEIKTTTLPAITKKQLDAALVRITKGEVSVIDKLKTTFILSDADLKAISDAAGPTAKIKPTLSVSEFASAVKEVAAGTQTAEGIIATFNLSKEQIEQISQ